MKLHSPLYYKKFSCIAEKCRHSCCIGWEIAVDEETLAKYKRDKREDILEHLSEGDDGCEIVLGDGERCPFLDECGLCRIISECGEAYTSAICREHPRFYHRVGNACEVGVGVVCEEAARLILTEADFSSTYLVGEHSGDVADETDFDTVTERRRIYSCLLDESLSYRERINAISVKYGVAERLSEDFSEAFSSLEYLEEENSALFELGAAEERKEMQEFALRFFAYLVFRHVSVATDEENLRARVGFCLLLLAVFENAVAGLRAPSLPDAADVIRRISSEIEYSEDNTSALIFEFESSI